MAATGFDCDDEGDAGNECFFYAVDASLNVCTSN